MQKILVVDDQRLFTECLGRAVKAVASGNSYFCAVAIEVMKTQFSGACGTASADASMELFSKYKLLSAKEKEVFDLIARRMDVAQIARRLGKSVKTVENQRAAAYAKMNVHDRLEAVEAGKVLGLWGSRHILIS